MYLCWWLFWKLSCWVCGSSFLIYLSCCMICTFVIIQQRKTDSNSFPCKVFVSSSGKTFVGSVGKKMGWSGNHKSTYTWFILLGLIVMMHLVLPIYLQVRDGWDPEQSWRRYQGKDTLSSGVHENSSKKLWEHTDTEEEQDRQCPFQ